jgi:hypothetical protein
MDYLTQLRIFSMCINNVNANVTESIGISLPEFALNRENHDRRFIMSILSKMVEVEAQNDDEVKNIYGTNKGNVQKVLKTLLLDGLLEEKKAESEQREERDGEQKSYYQRKNTGDSPTRATHKRGNKTDSEPEGGETPTT